jgi:hypothetical protein
MRRGQTVSSNYRRSRRFQVASIGPAVSLRLDLFSYRALRRLVRRLLVVKESDRRGAHRSAPQLCRQVSYLKIKSQR